MPDVDLICLANARKRSERCIACLHPESGAFIRLVSDAEHGELTYAQRNLGAYGEPRKLDLIRVNIAAKKPRLGQPENCLVDSRPWQLLQRPASAEKLGTIQRAVQARDWIFGTIGDRISSATFAPNPPASSLALVRPTNVRWFFETIGSKHRTRAVFGFDRSNYNFSLTDPPLEEQFKRLPNGLHPSSSVDLRDERLLFCLSLGEPFSDGKCYKLVAGVIELDAP